MIEKQAGEAVAEPSREPFTEQGAEWREGYHAGRTDERNKFVSYELVHQHPDEEGKPPRYNVYGIYEDGVRAHIDSIYLRDVIVAQLEREIAEKDKTLSEETARRKFMQVWGRYLGWGLVGPNREPGVACYGDSEEGQGRHRQHVVLYAEQPDKDQAERDVIDASIAQGDLPQDQGWIHGLIAERQKAEKEARALRAGLSEGARLLRSALRDGLPTTIAGFVSSFLVKAEALLSAGEHD